MTMVSKYMTSLIADMAEGERESLTFGALRIRGLKKTIPGNGQREVDCDARIQP